MAVLDIDTVEDFEGEAKAGKPHALYQLGLMDEAMAAFAAALGIQENEAGRAVVATIRPHEYA